MMLVVSEFAALRFCAKLINQHKIKSIIIIHIFVSAELPTLVPVDLRLGDTFEILLPFQCNKRNRELLKLCDRKPRLVYMYMTSAFSFAY